MCLAIPRRVESVSGSGIERRGWITIDRKRCSVALGATPEVSPGDYVIVHAGIALRRLSNEDARRALTLFAALEAVAP